LTSENKRYGTETHSARIKANGVEGKWTSSFCKKMIVVLIFIPVMSSLFRRVRVWLVQYYLGE